MYNAYLSSAPVIYNSRDLRPIDKARVRYMTIVELLPSIARIRQWPLSTSKEFSRVILDNICQDDWRKVLESNKGAVYRQLSIAQLEQGVAIAQSWIDDDESLRAACIRSRQWRENS